MYCSGAAKGIKVIQTFPQKGKTIDVMNFFFLEFISKVAFMCIFC